jgi:hypothetical protein
MLFIRTKTQPVSVAKSCDVMIYALLSEQLTGLGLDSKVQLQLLLLTADAIYLCVFLLAF